MAARSEAVYPVGWKNGRVASWLVTVDHKRIGILYIATSIFFFALGGILAILMRAQLATPNQTLLTKNSYNEVLTMHGTTMVFLVVVPIMAGFGNYLVPLMIGARDMAFPRLNAFSLWLTVFGGLLLYYSLVGGYGLYGAGGAPDVGWFAYAPLTSKTFSPGHSTDYWTLALLVSGFGSIATAINIITTVFCLRCPGCPSAGCRSSSGSPWPWRCSPSSPSARSLPPRRC